MTQFYAEALRGVGWRDNNFKPLASNDPTNTTISWTPGSGVTATSDGDIITFSGTSASFGLTGSNISSLGLTTTAYPYIVFRAKAANGGTLDVTFNYTVGSDIVAAAVTLTSSYQTFSIKAPTSGKTYQNVIFGNQSVAGNILCDYVYICSKVPVQLSQKDVKNGTITRTSLGNDHAELELDNYRGKFTANIFGTTNANAIGFGDHLHIYLGQGATLFHVYGGYVEHQTPVQPPDNLLVHSRGFGLALLRSKVLQIYNNQSIRAVVNDVTDNFVNKAARNGLVNDSGGNAFTGYQLTRSFVQNDVYAPPLYVASLNHAYNVLHELADLSVFALIPYAFFVDPAENLHWVPLGNQGAANWTSDPFPALYGGSMAYGTSMSSSNLTRDTESLVNRVHYYGIAQVPGQVDGISEYANDGAFQADWDTERLTVGTTAALNSVASPVAIGGHSDAFTFTPPGGAAAATGAALYPKTHSSTFIDFTKLGSQWSPPLIELYLRFHVTGVATFAGHFCTIYFANDSTHRCEYRIVNNPINTNNSILNINSPVMDTWYHLLVPVGPNAGNLFLSAPTPNFVAQPTLLTPPYQNIVGSIDWTAVKYFGVDMSSSDATQIGDSAVMYLDGVRILGGRYRIAYDNRTVAGGRYQDISEAYYYDPVSKDETAIKGFAAAEQYKLRNGLMRGSVIGPLLADVVPEQQVKITDPSANLSAQYLRCTSVIHHISPNGFLTELVLTDDFTNSRPLDKWKLMNALLEMGENAIFSRQLYDLKSAVFDPTFSPLTDPYT